MGIFINGKHVAEANEPELFDSFFRPGSALLVLICLLNKYKALNCDCCSMCQICCATVLLQSKW